MLIKSETLPTGISPGVSTIVTCVSGTLLFIDFNVVPEYFEVVILSSFKSKFIIDDFPTFDTPKIVALTFLFLKILFIFLIIPFTPYLFLALTNAISSGTIPSSASLAFTQFEISVG